MQALVWDTQDGKTYQSTNIPATQLPAAAAARKHLLEELALVDETLFEHYTRDPSSITAKAIQIALRQGGAIPKNLSFPCERVL